jgi:hypothetical protein
MDEQWTPLVGIPEIEGQFLISNKGRVKRIAFNNYTKTEFKKMHTIKTGYVYVQFYYNGTNHPVRLHRLVAQHFVPNPNGYEEVNHKDGNKQNNCADNLEWCSRSHNVKHSFEVGLKTPHRWTEEERKRIAENVRKYYQMNPKKK